MSRTEQSKQHALPASYDDLVRQYGKRVLSVAYEYVKDYDLAQDVAQEVFIRVWQKGSEFRARASLFSWIYRITVNLAIDHLRKNRSRNKLSAQEGLYTEQYRSEQQSGSTHSVPGDDIERHYLRYRIDNALEVLSKNQKRAFVLRYFQEMPIDQIAEIMGCQESTVRQHLFRATRKLQEELKDLGDRFRFPGGNDLKDRSTE